MESYMDDEKIIIHPCSVEEFEEEFEIPLVLPDEPEPYIEQVLAECCTHVLIILKENNFDIEGDLFMRDFNGLVEFLRAIMYRETGLDHPFTRE